MVGIGDAWSVAWRATIFSVVVLMSLAAWVAVSLVVDMAAAAKMLLTCSRVSRVMLLAVFFSLGLVASFLFRVGGVFV